MRVSICSVGSEVVLGDQIDSNAAWLSQRLREIGVEVANQVTVGDDVDQIVATLRWLVDNNEAVIVGGGLGPTPDDVTREAVAEATGCPLEHRDELEEQIRQRFADHGHRMPAANLRQARVPKGAVPYAPVGTAPGFRLELPAEDAAPPCQLYVLPGVPWELQSLYERDVLPHLLQRVGGGASVTRVVHVTGMGESSVAESLGPLLQRLTGNEGLSVSFLATGEEIQVRVTARDDDPHAARDRSQPVVEEVKQLLGRAVSGVDDQRTEDAIAELLRERGEKVAFAESATAGLLSARMARSPGASEILGGGMALYATDAKSSVLGVPEELIEEHSPVSEEVTRDMAVRVREAFDVAWGVAVTGVAGPGAQGGKPIGTVVWAVAGPDGDVFCRQGQFPGDRDAIRSRLASAALESLRRRLLESSE
ncbi:MAG: CinA family nicotinamide mononucleotide deamidase-related protein [Nitriliruptorales bacterium]|nr:CinA family nicotinamide mononucleotide deamidase-related protein [Nitriliruptorales bacterium]